MHADYAPSSKYVILKIFPGDPNGSICPIRMDKILHIWKYFTQKMIIVICLRLHLINMKNNYRLSTEEEEGVN